VSGPVDPFAPPDPQRGGLRSSATPPAQGAPSTGWYSAPAPVPAPAPVSAWVVVLVAVSSLALLVGLGVTAVGLGLLLRTQESYTGPYAEEEYADEFDDIAENATFEDLAGSGSFSGLRTLPALEEGECFSVGLFDDDYVGLVDRSPCEEAHEYEVMTATALPDGSYPGGDRLYDELHRSCEDAFADYIGAPYLDSVADYALVVPTERGWEEGERATLCAVFRYDLSRTGSLEGSGE